MGRRRNAISSEDSDDDRPDEASASNPGANPQSASKGKKWTPGMSGKEQKARAKEQRFEQHRRKAERERRNEQKRASREQREEHGAVHAETTTAPSKPVGRPGGNVARLDPSQIRRELKRLFGRIEHGGGVSPSSGRAVEVGDVVVVLIEPEIVAQRKSGAEAWSQRLNKRGEKEFGLSDFLALGVSPGSRRRTRTRRPREGGARTAAGADARRAPEPPGLASRRTTPCAASSRGGRTRVGRRSCGTITAPATATAAADAGSARRGRNTTRSATRTVALTRRRRITDPTGNMARRRPSTRSRSSRSSAGRG